MTEEVRERRASLDPDLGLLTVAGIVVDERDNGPWEKVDPRTPRGKAIKTARIRRAAVLRRYGCSFEEIGWIIGVSPFTASVYALSGGVWPSVGNAARRNNLMGQAVLGAAIGLFLEGRVYWSWAADGEPCFRSVETDA